MNSVAFQSNYLSRNLMEGPSEQISSPPQPSRKYTPKSTNPLPSIEAVSVMKQVKVDAFMSKETLLFMGRVVGLLWFWRKAS